MKSVMETLMNSPQGYRAVIVLIFPALLAACGTSGGSGTSTGNPATTPVEDVSTSGVAAEAVGGALGGSSSGGSLASQAMNKAGETLSLFKLALPTARAGGNSCPTYRTASGAGCSTSGGTMWLNYNNCTFSTGTTQWNGFQSLTISSGSAACGSFPLPSSGGTQIRQYVSASGSFTPASVSEVTNFGSTTTIDDAAVNLSNFNSDSIPTMINGGYGAQVTFSAIGARTNVAVGHRLVEAGVYDHSISGSLTISESAGAATRTLQGNIEVYHNLLQIIGTSTFKGVVHSDACCLPISGVVSTVFSAGSNKQPLGQTAASMVGGTETLTFTGCGSATLTTFDGLTKNVTLSRCF